MQTDERIARASAAIAVYAAIPGVDRDCAIQDLLSDLLHLAAQESSDPEGVLRRAVMNYEAERDEDATVGDGTSGQDRESYSDAQDRDSYLVD